MRDNKTIMLAAGIATAGIWAGVYLALHNGMSPSSNSRPHEAVGWMMARQAMGLLKGGQIAVIARDTTVFENPASDIQLAAFRKTLRKSGLAIGSLHLLQVDPLRQVEVPPGDFAGIIRKSSPGSVIVSFMGPPCLTEAQQNQLAGANPAIVALCSGSVPECVDLRSLFQQGLLQVAILDRRDAKVSSATSSDPKTCFDQWFMAVTPSDTSSLPPVAQQEQR